MLVLVSRCSCLAEFGTQKSQGAWRGQSLSAGKQQRTSCTGAVTLSSDLKHQQMFAPWRMEV